MPVGFSPASKFMIGTIGFGDTAFKQVTRVWRWESDVSVELMLVQSPKPFDIAGGEPADVNGEPGQRALQRDPRDPEAAPELTLAWNDDGAFFALTGRIEGPLDEQVLLKVAGSAELQ
jgi:hypothetical protein